MKHLKTLLFLVIFSIPAIAFADLTGRWSCNDGGNDYLRQLGKEVFWYGERSQNSPAWSASLQDILMETRSSSAGLMFLKGQ